MKIDHVRAHALALPQRITYKMSVATYSQLRTVVVEVETDEGHLGVGQASITAPAYSPYGETLEGAVHAINEVLGPAILGLDPLAIEMAHASMQRAMQGNPSAKTAIDLALHDIAGNALGVPVYSLLGGPLRTEIPLLASIGFFPTEEMVDLAVEAATQGYQVLKIRVGVELNTDEANLAALRKRLGDEFSISIDFKQALSEVHGRPDQAIGYIRRLERYGIDTVEQPVAGWDFENMARICEAIDTPIIADESIWTLQDAQRAIRMGAGDIIKIKIMKTCGLLGAKKMAALCEAAGVPLIIGHGIAGAIQNAAEAHLAAALPNWKAPGEMNGFLKLERDAAAPLDFDNGALRLSGAPGLGVSFIRSEVEALAVA